MRAGLSHAEDPLAVRPVHLWRTRASRPGNAKDPNLPDGVSVYRARPPYAQFLPAAVPFSPVSGDVFAIAIRKDTDPGSLGRITRRVMRLTQPAAVVALFRSESCDEASAVRLAAGAGLRVVSLEQEPLESALRKTLTDLRDLPRAFRHWLRISEVTTQERLVRLLAGIVREAVRQWQHGSRAGLAGDARPLSVQQIASTVELTPRGLRDAFARSRLPSPVQWKILARDLVHALVIQREAGKPLTRLAMSLGYADSQALSRAFHQRFGVTPSFARERLGWQWLALRWRERHAVDQNRQSTADSDHVFVPDNHHLPQP